MIAPILVAELASGQEGIPLDRYDPAIAASKLFALDDPEYSGHLRPRVGLTLGYAHRPLVLVDQSAGSNVKDVVRYQLTLHALGAIELFERLVLEAAVPMTLSQRGSALNLREAALVAPKRPALNDIRVGARVGLLRQERYLPAVALGLSGWFPSGDSEAYTSTGQPRFAASVLAGAEYASWLWRVSMGRRRQAASPVVTTARSDWTFGAGAAVKLGGFSFGPEVYGATVDDATHGPLARASTGVELLFGAHQRLGDFAVGAALAPGLNNAPGTPAFRGLLSVSWAPEVSARPANRVTEALASPGAGAPAPGDGPSVSGSSTPAAAAPGAASAATMVPMDTDGDGVADSQDACLDRAGDAGAKRLGCPLDTDADGVFDVDDSCPAEPGQPSNDARFHGCPPDTDGDGIVDALDACPEEQGAANDDAKLNGCKSALVVKGQQLLLVEQIHFETGKDVIRQESFSTLKQIAELLAEQETIARVAVDGHTDDVGHVVNNLALSRRRALSVTRWLIEHGVDERRLEARGFGPRRPLKEGSSPEARASNRRVEFHVLKRSADGRAAWKDGSVSEP